MSRTRAIDLSTSRDLAAVTLRRGTRVVNFGEDGSMRLLGMAIDVFLAVIGLGLFVYGDLAVHRTARIVGVIVTTVAVVVAAILASMREREG
jgi:hypothetical protein